MPESHEPVEAIRTRRPSWWKSVLWGVVGGTAAMTILFVSLAMYAIVGSPGAGSGLAGAFFSGWLYYLFVVCVIPAWLYGAVLGAVASRYSGKVFVSTALILPLAMLVIGGMAFAMIESNRHEAAMKEYAENERLRAEDDRIWKIEFQHSGDGLQINNFPPTPGIDAPLKPAPPTAITKKPGESGILFSGSEPGPPWLTMTLSWPDPDKFEAVFDFEAEETEETRIVSGFLDFGGNTFPELAATLDGVPVELPIVIRPSDRPQQLVVRGRMPW